MEPISAGIATLGIAWGIYVIMKQASRLYATFGLSAEDITNFDDVTSFATVGAPDYTATLRPRSTFEYSV